MRAADGQRRLGGQVYLALIAAQLPGLYRGERPNRRQMEAIQFYQPGWATLEELRVKLQPAARPKKR